jgi:hypothetical protein
MKWFRGLSNWLGDVFRSDRTWTVARMEDTPDVVMPGIVYLIGDGPTPWAASFLCPCGCKETISLSLIPTDRPSWRVQLPKSGLITLHPSVWRTKGCRSHFFIRGGRVVWAKAIRH